MKLNGGLVSNNRRGKEKRGGRQQQWEQQCSGGVENGKGEDAEREVTGEEEREDGAKHDTSNRD
jgi:hypothetical protein